jgi:hypothetical protein
VQGCAVAWACGVYLGSGIVPDQGRCPSRPPWRGALLLTGRPGNKAAGQRVFSRAGYHRLAWLVPSNWRPSWAHTRPLAGSVASTDRITAAQRVLYVRIVYLGESDVSTRRHHPELGICSNCVPWPRLSCGTQDNQRMSNPVNSAARTKMPAVLHRTWSSWGSIIRGASIRSALRDVVSLFLECAGPLAGG